MIVVEEEVGDVVDGEKDDVVEDVEENGVQCEVEIEVDYLVGGVGECVLSCEEQVGDDVCVVVGVGGVVGEEFEEEEVEYIVGEYCRNGDNVFYD